MHPVIRKLEKRNQVSKHPKRDDLILKMGGAPYTLQHITVLGKRWLTFRANCPTRSN